MTETQTIKAAVVAATGLSRDALHIYVGLGVYLLTLAVSRRPLRSLLPWLLVLGVAVAGECVDRHDDLLTIGHWRRMESLHDLVNTAFWPTVLMLLARVRALA